MKIRIKVPEEYFRTQELRQKFVDDVLLWGMETEMDISFYDFHYPGDRTYYNDRRLWEVFTVEADYSYMFSLKWGAVLHKKQKEEK